MKFISYKLPLFIFGFTILALQIIGIRILAPYIGTTAPVLAGLIGVSLLASMFGYFNGGFFADRFLKKEIITIAGFLAGLWIVMLSFTRHSIIPFLIIESYGISSFFISLVIFFPPVFLISSLIIYIIRIQIKKPNVIAKVHGDSYSMATIGSILGVFITSHVLTPFFSVSLILKILGFLVIIFSILPIIQKR